MIEAAGTISERHGRHGLHLHQQGKHFGRHRLPGVRFRGKPDLAGAIARSFKKHPSVAPLIAGSEVKEYAAHLIPEGGYKAIPQLCSATAGWSVGDAGQLNNAIHREGSNLAMTSGRLAGEAIFQIKSRREPMTKANLALYKKMLDDSFVMKDLKKYKDMPDLLHTQSQNFFLTYPQLVSKAMENFLRVDGTPKIDKEKDTFRNFRKTRGSSA